MHGVPTVRLRFFMVYGPGQPCEGPYAVVTGIFERAKAEGRPLVVHGDGTQTRDFIHVTDVAEACVKAMQSPALVDDTINVGTGVSTSIGDLAIAVQPDESMRTWQPACAFDLRHTLSDTSAMLRDLRFRPLRHLRCPPSQPQPQHAHAEHAHRNRLHLVVCRYDEDVSWTDRWADNRIVYNKGADDLTFPSVRLENVGRDSDAYLQHILRFYPDFADVTVFCQGSVGDHCDSGAFAGAVDELLVHGLGTYGYLGFSNRWGDIDGFVDPVWVSDDAKPLRESWEAAFGGIAGNPSGAWRCNYNGLFAASRERLLRYPRENYEALLGVQRMLDPKGFANERMWTPMFT